MKFLITALIESIPAFANILVFLILTFLFFGTFGLH